MKATDPGGKGQGKVGCRYSARHNWEGQLNATQTGTKKGEPFPYIAK
jgi:hypothetical protein